jgi:hypothetical protein
MNFTIFANILIKREVYRKEDVVMPYQNTFSNLRFSLISRTFQQN